MSIQLFHTHSREYSLTWITIPLFWDTTILLNIPSIKLQKWKVFLNIRWMSLFVCLSQNSSSIFSLNIFSWIKSAMYLHILSIATFVQQYIYDMIFQVSELWVYCYIFFDNLSDSQSQSSFFKYGSAVQIGETCQNGT